MPRKLVNGVELYYEIVGESGPPVVLQDPLFPVSSNLYSGVVAGRMSSSCTALLFDRRNLGASDFAITDAESFGHQYTDDLHQLLEALDLSPAYIGGRALGGLYGLLMAHRYPEDVKGIVIDHVPTDDPELQRQILGMVYLRHAEVAESAGMEATIAASEKAYLNGNRLAGWIAETAILNPKNRDRLLSTDASKFAETMRRWGEYEISERLPLMNLEDEEIGKLSAPAIVVPGNDPIHPAHASRRAYDMLPNAEWADFSERFARDGFERLAEESASLLERLYGTALIYEDFIRKVESGLS